MRFVMITLIQISDRDFDEEEKGARIHQSGTVAERERERKRTLQEGRLFRSGQMLLRGRVQQSMDESL